MKEALRDSSPATDVTLIMSLFAFLVVAMAAAECGKVKQNGLVYTLATQEPRGVKVML